MAGQCLRLLPERAIYWPEGRTLFVADVHLGKGAAFRSMGIPIPEGSTEDTLNRLSRLLDSTEALRLDILGDLWHAKAGRTAETTERFGAWRERHRDLEVTLIEGNHDLRSGKLDPGWNVREVAEPFERGPFALCHFPETSVERGFRLAGHLHPGVLLEGKGRQSLRLPCFYFSGDGAILPAFGSFTGLALVEPGPGDHVFVLAGDSVVRVA